MRELSIVVTCSHRKSLRPAPGLRVRDLPRVSLPERADIWRARVRGAVDDRRPLLELYHGEGWNQVRTLLARAETAGYRPALFVASAGLGLRAASTLAPGYAATFSLAQPDSVAMRVEDSQAWWTEVSAMDGATSLAHLPPRPTLLVLSAAYARPLARDLRALAERQIDALLIGGFDDIEDMKRLPADLALRAALGGTATSLNIRMAAAWLERLDGEPLTSALARKRWDEWSSRVRREVAWDRAPISDAEVASAIAAMLDAQPSRSRTAALRLLRDSGRACEQRRFAGIYTRVLEGRQ